LENRVGAVSGSRRRLAAGAATGGVVEKVDVVDRDGRDRGLAGLKTPGSIGAGDRQAAAQARAALSDGVLDRQTLQGDVAAINEQPALAVLTVDSRNRRVAVGVNSLDRQRRAAREIDAFERCGQVDLINDVDDVIVRRRIRVDSGDDIVQPAQIAARRAVLAGDGVSRLAHRAVDIRRSCGPTRSVARPQNGRSQPKNLL
jgi:hypothetical protein